MTYRDRNDRDDESAVSTAITVRRGMLGHRNRIIADARAQVADDYVARGGRQVNTLCELLGFDKNTSQRAKAQRHLNAAFKRAGIGMVVTGTGTYPETSSGLAMALVHRIAADGGIENRDQKSMLKRRGRSGKGAR